MAIKVKQFNSVYGITDGKKWHAAYFQSKAAAEAWLPMFDTPEKIRVNVGYDAPFLIGTVIITS